MMLRRIGVRLAIVVAGLVIAGPLGAQVPHRVPTMGFLVPGPGWEAMVDAFRHGLRELGYVDGKNLNIALRIAREPKDQPAPAALATARVTSTKVSLPALPDREAT